jgi:tRNA (guanine37-N1)-methyltransferase
MVPSEEAKVHFDILTLFPDIFQGFLSESILRRAMEAGLVSISLHNIRDYATDRHRTTDDYPYGGGGGMVMKPEPIFCAVEDVLAKGSVGEEVPIILLSPQGRLFTQGVAWELARRSRLLLICGRYEGVDERVREHLATDEISIGDYVLNGGEVPAMALVEAVARLVPGVLGEATAPFEDSHSVGLLEYPHYTRPAVFQGWTVPEVLMSGDHARIVRWRREQMLYRTRARRPELLAGASLSSEDRRFLEGLQREDTAECQT